MEVEICFILAMLCSALFGTLLFGEPQNISDILYFVCLFGIFTGMFMLLSNLLIKNKKNKLVKK